MIRVLHIVGKMDRAGAETMLMNLYRHIDRTQVQFDFITFTTDQGDYDEEILALGGKIFPIIASNSIERMFKLTSFLKQHPEYKIIHAHMLLSNVFHLLAARNARIQHRISHCHSTSNGKNDFFSNIYEKISIFFIKKLATKKIACGQEAAKYLFNTTKDVWLLNNAINLRKYIEISKNNWNNIISFQGLKLIQVGRLNEVKNHLFSLQIAQELKKRGIQFTFIIVGQGALEQELREKVNEYSLNDFVHFLGIREDVPQLMAGADIMLMPSLHEGFPVVLVESQAIGLPSIISDNISKEVDLGLNLVEFKSITDIDSWIKCLTKFEPALIPENDIIEKLTINGFDVVENSRELERYYLSL